MHLGVEVVSVHSDAVYLPLPLPSGLQQLRLQLSSGSTGRLELIMQAGHLASQGIHLPERGRGRGACRICICICTHTCNTNTHVKEMQKEGRKKQARSNKRHTAHPRQ